MSEEVNRGMSVKEVTLDMVELAASAGMLERRGDNVGLNAPKELMEDEVLKEVIHRTMRNGNKKKYIMPTEGIKEALKDKIEEITFMRRSCEYRTV